MKSGVMTLCALAMSAFGQDTAGTGTISGLITGSPGQTVSGISVCVDTTPRCVASASDGRFRIADVRAGVYKLRIAGLTAEVEVRAGLASQVEVALPDLNAGTQSVTVSGSVFVAPEEVKTSGYIVPGEEIFKAAGAQQDV